MELALFVEPGCESSDRALTIAEQLRRLLPKLDLKIIDVSAGSGTLPEAVFAIPTYLLDGRVISLGNPEIDDLVKAVKARYAALKDR